jgi:hypothetical protein
MTAHGMHAVKQARQAASPHAQQQQHEMRQRAAVRSQPQWTNYAAVSAAPEPQIVRTNSSGSSGSASSSSSSTYAASRQQQQLMQVACQSELFAGSGRDVHAGARPAVAADAVQQHKQHMAALQVIEDEIAYLVRRLKLDCCCSLAVVAHRVCALLLSLVFLCLEPTW